MGTSVQWPEVCQVDSSPSPITCLTVPFLSPRAQNDHTKLDEFGRWCLHGNGCNRWYDKSLNLIVGKNGRVRNLIYLLRLLNDWRAWRGLGGGDSSRALHADGERAAAGLDTACPAAAAAAATGRFVQQTVSLLPLTPTRCRSCVISNSRL